MGTIAWLWAAAFVWVCAIPLLVAGGTKGGGLPPETRAFAWMAAIVVVVAPALRRAPLSQSLALLLFLFVALRVVSQMAFAGEPLYWLVEFVYVGGAIAVAARLGRALESADDALEEIAAGRARDRVARFDEAQEEIYREIRRARRYDRPASLIALSTAGMDEPAVERLMREVKQMLARRYAEGQLAKLLLDETDAAALITRRDDHFVVLLPEVESDRAQRVAGRLASAASERWGLRVCAGIASFPEEEVTFEGLLERATTELRAEERVASAARRHRNGARGRDLSVPVFAAEKSNGSAASSWPEA